MFKLVVAIAFCSLTVNSRAVANVCSQAFVDTNRVFAYSEIDANLADQLVGNWITLEVKPRGEKLKIIQGQVIGASISANKSILIRYINEKGERFVYEHAPFMLATEKIKSLSFENKAQFDLKRETLESDGYRRVRMDTYLLLADRYPQKAFHVFVQTLGQVGIRDFSAELVSRPSVDQIATAQITGKGVKLNLKLTNGDLIEVLSTDVVQLFVK